MGARQVPINPNVLNWAIEESGRDLADIADAIGIDPLTLDEWLASSSRPTVGQFRKLASALRRPSATFLLPAPPPPTPHRVEFRNPPGCERRALNYSERVRLREAARLQRGLSWVAEELGVGPVPIPKYSTTTSAERAASRVRELLDVTTERQIAWSSEYEALREWRAAIERIGVVVAFLSVGSDSMRGFSSWNDRVPLIAVNTYWNAKARIYTLAHELAHLATRTNSACEEAASHCYKGTADPVERWCEEFAASLLLPWSNVVAFLIEEMDWDEEEKITDLAVPTKLSRKFHVSLRASVLRLVNRGAAGWDLYRKIPPANDGKKAGGGGAGRNRPKIRFDEYGRRTGALLFAGIHQEVLSVDDALGYLHLGDSELPEFERLVQGE